MPVNLQSQLRARAVDGVLDRKELLATALSMLDGRGITPTEKKTLAKTFKALDAAEDVVIADETREAFGVLMRKLNPYSRTRRVFAPGATAQTLRDIITLKSERYTAQRARFSPKSRADLEDPRLPIFALNRVGDPRYEKRAYRGPLFVDGLPAPRDAVQGFINGCFFSGAAAAVAHARPEQLARRFVEHDDGTVTVAFCDRETESGEATERVDRDFYYDQNYDALLFGSGGGAKSRRRMRTWYPLLEKAYAQRVGSYEVLNQGGYEVEALEALVPGVGKTATIDELSDDELVAVLARATRNRWPMTAGTFGARNARRYSKTGLTADHSYAFLGVTWRDGAYRVRLYNPWGEGEPSGNGRDDGVFELTLERFRHYYQLVSWVEVDEAEAATSVPSESVSARRSRRASGPFVS